MSNVDPYLYRQCRGKSKGHDFVKQQLNDNHPGNLRFLFACPHCGLRTLDPRNANCFWEWDNEHYENRSNYHDNSDEAQGIGDS